MAQLISGECSRDRERQKKAVSADGGIPVTDLRDNVGAQQLFAEPGRLILSQSGMPLFQQSPADDQAVYMRQVTAR